MKRVALFIMMLWMIGGMAADIISSGNLRKGMKGEGRSVFKGTEIETFQVEVLGLLKDQAPGENRVLIQCDGPAIDDNGIVAGMSGSPVYFDGKLAGAVAFGWEFGKKPIGGLTPIEAMRNVIRLYGTSRNEQQIRFEKLPDLNRILNPDGRSLLPDPLRERMDGNLFLNTGFRNLPFRYTATASAGQDPDAPDSLRPGSAVAVGLVRGDLNLFGLGTVTEVDGNNVLAFGHPMFGLGSVSLPMHTATVLATYPSYRISNKIGAIGPEVGVVVEDRNAGIYGITGRKAPMIPLTVQVNLPGGTRTYEMELADHQLLTPFLANATLNSLFTTLCVQVGFNTFNVRGRIDIQDHPPLKLEALVPDMSTGAMTAQIGSLLQSVMQNPYDEVTINGITLTLNYTESLRVAQLMKVKADRTRVKPGGTVHLQLFIKPFQRDMFIKNVTLTIPESLPEGEYTIEAGDGFSIMSRESKVLKRRIESLDGFIRMVNRFLKNNKIYASIAETTDALFMGETVQSSLPGSITETVRMQGVHVPDTDQWKEYRAVDVVTLNDVVHGHVEFPIIVSRDSH